MVAIRELIQFPNNHEEIFQKHQIIQDDIKAFEKLESKTQELN